MTRPRTRPSTTRHAARLATRQLANLQLPTLLFAAPLFASLLLAALLLAGCHATPPDRSPLTRAFDRDPAVALPAIAELGQGTREESLAVLQHIAHDPDAPRRDAAVQALRERARRARESPDDPAAAARAEIEAANDALVAHLRAGDMAAVAAAYADDAVLLDASGLRISGRQAIDAYWMSLQEPRDWVLSVLDVEGRGDLWVQRGRSRLTSAPGGQPHVSEVEFVLVWQRQADGRLAILVDAWW